MGEKGSDESSAAPHGSVGEGDEDDSPNDGSNSGDSNGRGVGNSLARIPSCSTTGAEMAMNGVHIPMAATVLTTEAGDSLTWVEVLGGGTFLSEVHITVRSNVSGDVESVLETLPGVHFPVPRSTTGAGGGGGVMLSISLSRPHGLIAQADWHAAGPPDDLSNVFRSEYHWNIFNREDLVILAFGPTDEPTTVT